MAPDEAYYWVWSHALAPGYLDHPPMVALWIRAGTWLLGEGNLGVRLLAPLAAGLGTLLLAQAAEDLLPGRRAGLIAGVLMNATLIFAVGATTLTPDTPLLLFWTATLWALARLLVTGNGLWWLTAGLAAGLAMDTKYTAVLLGPAILTWLLIVHALRPWLRRWQPWAAALIATLLFTPVLLWNAGHGFASFVKQGGRAGDFDPGRAVQYLAELAGGQIGLATPGIAVLLAAGAWCATRRAWSRDPAWTLLACFILVPSAVFTQHALGDRVQANWPAIVYPAACIAAAGITPRLLAWWRHAAALGFALTGAIWVQAIWAPVALPMLYDPTLLRLGGWQTLAREIDAAATAEGASFIASDNYSHAALLARLLPQGRIVVGAEGRWALFSLPDGTAAITGQTGLLVRSARRDDAPDPRPWSAITRLPPLTRARDGMTAEGFRLYRVTGRASDAPIAVMPRAHPGAVP
jgi:4-amino-4-deoxy-L-arabinose transferase-like glycosyltransferase